MSLNTHPYSYKDILADDDSSNKCCVITKCHMINGPILSSPRGNAGFMLE